MKGGHACARARGFWECASSCISEAKAENSQSDVTGLCIYHPCVGCLLDKWRMHACRGIGYPNIVTRTRKETFMSLLDPPMWLCIVLEGHVAYVLDQEG